MKIDYNMSGLKRGKFKKIAVEIDIDNPLPSAIQINGKYQRIEYEDIATIYYKFSRYGHTDD
ncbi:hypothetical protein Scep_019883 [Stephania cephalantha]|uniref:Uncharacterized protein n=1 Tax=Stephania cephalantha TaxID=152367 RepID=A0AAP0IBN2_9MAGN